MKIAILGSGGVGGYYGGLLAMQGHEVVFVARGAHYQALRQNGLQVRSIHGDFSVVPVKVTDDPAGIGENDLILFCVKSYDTDASAQKIKAVTGANTSVLSLQNGIDAAERIGKVIGMEHVLGGATWISSAIDAPGHIKQVSDFRRIVFGELDGSLSPRVQAIFEAFKATGVTVEISRDILTLLWTKYVFISSASSFGGLTRLPMGDWRNVPETRAMVVSLMKEVKAVGSAHGARLEADVVEKSLAFMDAAAAHIKASMQLDVESGRQFELESMVGAIGRKGREVGVPTPTADAIYAVLLPVNLKAINRY
ncbi:MAG TPA: 2-dehydropantoate 2-reductase [Anaerolineales bacterium]|jgi:2-dehydropantoate 2-reductase